jgi:hypothetical protein
MSAIPQSAPRAETDAATLLTRLILLTELSLTRPVGLSSANVEALYDLEAEISWALTTAVPEGGRLICEQHEVLADVLIKIEVSRAQGDARNEKLWRQLAGVMLPHVREDLSAALAHRSRRATV